MRKWAVPAEDGTNGRAEARVCSDDPAHLSDTVAVQLARALDNPGLFAHDLAMLYETPEGRAAPLDLAQLVRRLLQQTQTVAALEGGAALLYDLETDDWQVVAEVGTLPAYWPLPAVRQRALLDQLRHMLEPLPYPPTGAADGGLLLLLPLLAADRLVGALALPVPPGHRLATNLPLLRALAGRAAVLIYNVQLQLHAEELRIVEERSRIAREMHDSLAQTLNHIRIRCEYVSRILPTDPARARAELDQVRLDLKSSTGELVRIINALARPPLDDQGLVPALLKLGDEFSSPGRLRVEVVVPEHPLDLPPQVELIVFRAAQEWLRLVAWHLGVSRCRMVLALDGPQLVLSIQDNGSAGDPGPDSAAARPDAPPGLPAIRERVTALGGELDVLATRDSGARLVIRLPLLSACTP